MTEKSTTASTPSKSNKTAAGIEYAGFGLRLVAFVIDALILSVVVGIIVAVIPGIGYQSMGNDFIYFIVAWVYFAYMESNEHQGTLGKMAVGIKVTGMNGEQIDFGKASIRYFAKILSALILMVGYLMVIFTEKKQALHDILANCLVVKK